MKEVNIRVAVSSDGQSYSVMVTTGNAVLLDVRSCDETAMPVIVGHALAIYVVTDVLIDRSPTGIVK